jgi:putative ABC transport system ATP-binding protein
MEVLITLKGLSKNYRTDSVVTSVLQDIDIQINKGDFVSISGESGSGKSTLLSIFGLLDEQSEGVFLLKDIDTSNLSFDQRAVIRNKHIGMIFQSFNLIEEESVFENVSMPLLYRGVGKAETKERVTKAIEQVGLSHRMQHLPSQLSGGQQQRVAIARAIVGEPDILLVDEATGNLDSNSSSEIMELLIKLNERGTTICLITHEKKYAQMAKRQFHLKDGILIQS